MIEYKMLQVISTGLDHENEIWPIFAGDKLQNVWQEVKKKCSYLYEFKSFEKERLTATNEAIENGTGVIDSLGILKNKQDRKVNRNSESLSEKKDGESQEAPDGPIMISDKE